MFFTFSAAHVLECGVEKLSDGVERMLSQGFLCHLGATAERRRETARTLLLSSRPFTMLLFCAFAHFEGFMTELS